MHFMPFFSFTARFAKKERDIYNLFAVIDFLSDFYSTVGYLYLTHSTWCTRVSYTAALANCADCLIVLDMEILEVFFPRPQFQVQLHTYSTFFI